MSLLLEMFQVASGALLGAGALVIGRSLHGRSASASSHSGNSDVGAKPVFTVGVDSKSRVMVELHSDGRFVNMAMTPEAARHFARQIENVAAITEMK